jgi:hypothetical protein
MIDVPALAKRYRIPAIALAISAALHAAVFVGVPGQGDDDIVDEPAMAYSASLEAGPEAAIAPMPRPAPAHKPARRARLAPRVDTSFLEPPTELAPLPQVVADATPLLNPSSDSPQAPEPPEKVALAAPAAPVPALEAPKFPVRGLPAGVSITYALDSAFAKGRAVYEWSRDGDNYRVTGEAEAQGFFALFLEGRILQESYGTVTAEGLRPQRFTENRPGAAPEGLQFDWPAHRVTFERGDKSKTADLAENTVDWLSMIFQMAHVPPTGETYDLKVYTQRRLYNFKLKVLGMEEIEIPIGHVRALHLRHVDPEDQQVVDVWLGLDQHYLPVKLRYPVARNRLMVEQSATDISER